MNKHAYLIMAHNNFYNLEKLLLLLDSDNNDIFLHIDKKVKKFDYTKFKKLLKYSNIYFPSRINIRWGAPSQINAELELFKCALSTGEYSYYHVISGVDLPLKDVDYIYNFFESNSGKEFIGFCKNYDETKIKQINLFNSMGRNKNIFNSIKYKIRQLFIKIQILVKYDYTRKFNLVIKKGTNWVSITDDFVKYVIANEHIIKSLFKHSISGDELFLQTIIWNSPFKDKIYDIDSEYDSCMRFVDWNRGEPYTFHKEDFNLLMKSDKIFARKFDENTDKEIIDMIYSSLKR